MESETTNTYKITVQELCQKLGISGNLISCGFNVHKKSDNILEREITIKTNPKMKKIASGVVIGKKCKVDLS